MVEEGEVKEMGNGEEETTKLCIRIPTHQRFCEIRSVIWPELKAYQTYDESKIFWVAAMKPIK